jgi:hypothetical protein
MRLGTQTVTRKRAGATTDGYGNEVPDWGTTDDLPIAGCSVQPGGGSEFYDDRTATTIMWTVFSPVADVVDTDRIAYNGTDYEIDGAIGDWRVGTRLDHLEIRLKKVGG